MPPNIYLTIKHHFENKDYVVTVDMSNISKDYEKYKLLMIIKICFQNIQVVK